MSLECEHSASTAAGAFARFAATQRFEDLPVALIEKTKLRLLDTLGCGLAANARGNAASVHNGLVAVYGGGSGTVIGSAGGLPAPAAAYVNGALCHALDFDDTHPAAITNVGAVVVPAALAAGEAAGSSGSECLTALAVGSEIVVRIGLAAASAFLASGFSPTAVCGVFGAAAAAARLMRSDARGTTHVLAIAGSMAGGIYEHFADGSSTKLLYPGLAAQSGLLAAAFAAAGLDGPSTVLEGRFGVMRSHFGIHEDVLAEQLCDLGKSWQAMGTAFRPYPACNMLQSSLDAVREALRGHAVAPQDIRVIRVSVPEPAATIVLEPIEIKRAPRNAYDARFSLPYSVAEMVVHGSVGLDSYTASAIRNPEVLDIARRVEYVPREFATFPAGYPCAVEVETDSGETLSAALEFHRGGMENPMSPDELLRKFRKNAGEGLAPQACDVLEDAVLSLDEAPNLAGVTAALRAVRVSAAFPDAV